MNGPLHKPRPELRNGQFHRASPLACRVQDDEMLLITLNPGFIQAAEKSVPFRCGKSDTTRRSNRSQGSPKGWVVHLPAPCREVGEPVHTSAAHQLVGAWVWKEDPGAPLSIAL